MTPHASKLLLTILLSFCFFLVPNRAKGQVRRPGVIKPQLSGLAVKAADPVDVGTGIYSREYVDLFVKDSLPINFVRTQRNMDPRSRSFGIGGSTSYDMFIVGDVVNFSWVALVLADGSQTRYARVSPGHGFADGVFENRASPGEFLGSRISWNQHNAWTVALRDGTEYTVQGCDAKSKPGQCAVSEVKNANGERLTVQRDRDGNILRITSPHGHFVSVTDDSDGRITRVEDDSHRWVTYRYNDKGCLVEAVSWRHERQTFAYDSQYNMTFVHETAPPTKHAEAYDFEIHNFYDRHNRFSRQWASGGVAYSAKYTTDSDGHIRENDVQGPTGLSRYFFNAAGYETRQEYSPLEGAGWTLERVHDPNSNATVQVILKCQTQKTHLPLELDTPLGEAGEARISFLDEICQRLEKKLEPQPEPLPRNER
jgi:YD repeat-containing protein